jgi:hypothetical protein
MTRITEHDPKIFESEISTIPIGDKCCKDVCTMLNNSIISKDITSEHCISINTWAENIYIQEPHQEW